jgi:predicted HNH restriction endonuclease
VIVREQTERGECRILDPIPWSAVNFDQIAGRYTLQRGAPAIEHRVIDPEADQLGFIEGERLAWFTSHRRREYKLREAKIKEALKSNSGRLLCEVPGCGFDFVERYGVLGEGFAHVHHLAPLGGAPDDGFAVTLQDLAIVCPNCHAMIHRGGKCRPLEPLIRKELAF